MKSLPLFLRAAQVLRDAGFSPSVTEVRRFAEEYRAELEAPVTVPDDIKPPAESDIATVDARWAAAPETVRDVNPSDPGHAFDRTNDPDELRRLGKAWVETAAFHASNEAFYRDIVQKTGRILGRECHRQDDGNYADEPLALRVPEVAEKLCAARRLAEHIAATMPGATIGVSMSVVDDDWCVYVNGPGVIFGHSSEDAVQALADLANPLPWPVCYAGGKVVSMGMVD